MTETLYFLAGVCCTLGVLLVLWAIHIFEKGYY